MKKDPIKIYFFFGSAALLIIIFCIVTILSTFDKFVKKTGKSISYFYKNAQEVKKENNFASQSNLNVIILGLDERNDWLEKTQTTDTIMLTNINLKNGKINLISLPRDLWSFDQKAKINNIYQIANENNKNFDFIKEEYKKVTGQNIDRMMIINTQNLVDLMKIVGSVEITMEMDYKDDKYPNPEYIANSKSGAPIYKTVEFKKGTNIIDSSNVTEFVRSRKGAETAAAGGTDLGRINRQQQLISAIFNKIKSKEILLDPNKYIELYNLWQTNVKTDISDKDLISILQLFNQNSFNISVEKINLPISEDKKSDSIIFHPQTTKFTKQWIYLPNSETNYDSIHQFINKSLTN